MAHKRTEESNYISGGEFGTEPSFPPQIQERIDKGYRCGSGIARGWLPIVVELDKQIAQIDPDYVIHQIKEKFGGLRYYIETKYEHGSEENEQIYEAIATAEHQSMSTCDICGEPGEQTNRKYWIVTRCSQHDPKKGYDEQ